MKKGTKLELLDVLNARNDSEFYFRNDKEENIKVNVFYDKINENYTFKININTFFIEKDKKTSIDKLKSSNSFINLDISVLEDNSEDVLNYSFFLFQEDYNSEEIRRQKEIE